MTGVSRDDEPRVQVTPQLVLGLLVLIVGVLLTLDRLGLIDARAILRFWPAGLIALGLLGLWQSRHGTGNVGGGFLLTILGTWLLLDRADILRLRFSDIWPVLLLGFGGFLVWQAMSAPRRRALGGEAASTIHAVAILGGVARGSNSSTFRGGQVSAVMGGCEIDLRHASIDGEAVLDLFAMWGGIEIRVPDDWTVIMRVTPLLGGADDKTRPPQGLSRHRLVVRGVVMMAGVEIKN